jgi:NDP-sugar pyrophosphorylase family protein
VPQRAVEAIILAGGKAERLGPTAEGLPKPLVPVAGRPLAAYQVAALADVGVERVLISCAAGQGPRFTEELGGLGPDIVPVEEPERLGRGGGLRLAAQELEGDECYALNGDELIDLDFSELLTRHHDADAAGTIVVTLLESPFGIVELDEDDHVTCFEEAATLPHWVSCGVYVLGLEAIERLPERGDHERTTFPELAAERKLAAFRHTGLWLTVNTPKDLRRAEEVVAGGGLTRIARLG